MPVDGLDDGLLAVRDTNAFSSSRWLGSAQDAPRLVIGLSFVLILQGCASGPESTSQLPTPIAPTATPRPTQTPTPTVLPTSTALAELDNDLDNVLDQLDARVAISSPLTVGVAITASVQVSAGP